MSCDVYPPKETKAFKRGDWVVCFNTFLEPSTWGRVRSSDINCTWITEGKDAPTWGSDAWQTEYLYGCESEEQAKKIVQDYQNNLEYDERS